MRGLGCLLLLALASQALAARELKWGWSSASSLGQLTTVTGANTDAGMLSTVNPRQGNDGGMLAGGTQTGGLGNPDTNARVQMAALPPGVVRPPAIPGTPALEQAALRRARALASAPGPSAEFAGAPAGDIAGAPTADAPAQAMAEAPTVYVNTANVAVQTALAPGDAPSGAGAPAAIGFLPLLGGYPGPEPVPTPQQAFPDLRKKIRLSDVAVSREAGGLMPYDMAPGMAPALAPSAAHAPAPARAHVPARAPVRAPAPAPRSSGPFGRLPDPFLPNANKLIWSTAG